MAEETRNNPAQPQQDVSEQHKIRLEKLQAMQEAGHDPFKITKYDVTHHSTDVKKILRRSKAKPFRSPGV